MLANESYYYIIIVRVLKKKTGLFYCTVKNLKVVTILMACANILRSSACLINGCLSVAGWIAGREAQ